MNLTIEVRAKPEKYQELYQTLHALLSSMRTEYGCRESRIYGNVEEGEVFFFSMDWEDAAHLEAYMQTIGGGAILGAMDVLCKMARVRLGDDSPWEGIEVLKRMRKRSRP